jgi:hypothetical protein
VLLLVARAKRAIGAWTAALPALVAFATLSRSFFAAALSACFALSTIGTGGEATGAPCPSAALPTPGVTCAAAATLSRDLEAARSAPTGSGSCLNTTAATTAASANPPTARDVRRLGFDTGMDVISVVACVACRNATVGALRGVAWASLVRSGAPRRTCVPASASRTSAADE